MQFCSAFSLSFVGQSGCCDSRLLAERSNSSKGPVARKRKNPEDASLIPVSTSSNPTVQILAMRANVMRIQTVANTKQNLYLRYKRSNDTNSSKTFAKRALSTSCIFVLRQHTSSTELYVVGWEGFEPSRRSTRF